MQQFINSTVSYYHLSYMKFSGPIGDCHIG